MSQPGSRCDQLRWPSARVRGQESFLLSTATVELALTSLGGMMGPVRFFPDAARPVEPYHVAPWAEEVLPANTPVMLQALRGDWFCSAFGENAQPYRGKHLPPHGETANRHWRPIARDRTDAGCWMRLGVDLPLQGGYCEATTALLGGHSVIYQRHDLKDLAGPINPGHHATLQFPDEAGAGQLSCSPLRHAQSYLDFIDGPTSRGYSCLQPDTVFADLQSVPVVGGTTTDLTRFPARAGFDDVVILCADGALGFAWVAVTFASQGYVWFSLRNPNQLAATLLWFSNGGRRSTPWNGRHVNVMGIEDVTGFFHVGIAASCQHNLLSDQGIRTCLAPDADGRLSIPYIQGVARIPVGFDRVVTIELGVEPGTIRLRSAAGPQAEIACHIEFLRTGTLPGLELP